MKVEWTLRAEVDLLDHADFISQDSPGAAIAQILEVRTQVEQLADQPFLGRIGRLPRTRELVIARSPYIVAYAVNETLSTVFVIRVMHSSQQWKL